MRGLIVMGGTRVRLHTNTNYLPRHTPHDMW